MAHDSVLDNVFSKLSLNTEFRYTVEAHKPGYLGVSKNCPEF